MCVYARVYPRMYVRAYVCVCVCVCVCVYASVSSSCFKLVAATQVVLIRSTTALFRFVNHLFSGESPKQAMKCRSVN